MGAARRRTTGSVSERLFKSPFRFDFFQAVRVLERIFVRRESADDAQPVRVPVGRVNEEEQVVAPAREVARFRTRASLDFPASEVHQLLFDETQEKTVPPQLEVNFMGLTGPQGVLPHSYTELLMERLRAKDRTLHDFLDLFNHRLISFFFRAWEKYRFPVAYERRVVREQAEAERIRRWPVSTFRLPVTRTAELSGRLRTDDQFTAALYSFIGMGTRGLRQRQTFRDESLLVYGGLIAQRPHSASAVSAIVRDYFDVPARLAQFHGQWLALDAESVSRLGEANSTLGVTALAGARVWDAQSKFRLQLGPLTYAQFTAFLPPGSAYRPLQEMVRLLVGMEFDFDVQPLLLAAEVPGTVMTTRAKRRPMLGWTTWLKTQPLTADDGQVVLSGGVTR